MQREKQKNGDARGYMIAEQTHKSSINPWGVKEALFSFSRQPSQTEHHHKPSFLTSIFFLIFRACTHTLSHSPPFFPSFPTYLFLFLQIFYPSVLSPSQWITDKNKKDEIFTMRNPSLFPSPFLPHRWPKQDSLVKSVPCLIWAPGLWVTTWGRHRSICQRQSVCLIKPLCHSFTNSFHFDLTASKRRSHPNMPDGRSTVHAV